jgi:hypothetical protein
LKKKWAGIRVNNWPGWYLSKDNPANAVFSAAQIAEMGRRLDSLNNNNTNWIDYFFRTGRFQEHELSASGGNDKVRFYSSFNYYNQEGIAFRSDLERFTLEIILIFQVTGLQLQSVQVLVLQKEILLNRKIQLLLLILFHLLTMHFHTSNLLQWCISCIGMASGPRLAAATYNPLLPSNTGAPTVPYCLARVLVYDQREGSDALERLASYYKCKQPIQRNDKWKFQIKISNQFICTWNYWFGFQGNSW